jgi:drug/metabolite transporter (DMT)-like permease
MTSNHVRGLAALVVTSILWSMGGLFIKIVPFDALTVAGCRSALACIVLLAWMRRPQPTWSLPQWGGIVAYAATVILFVMATKRTTAANAILLQYTAPVWVALFSSAMTGERLRRADVATVAAVCCGMAVFFADRLSPGMMEGNLLAVASGIAFAMLALCMRAQRGVATGETILFGNILAAVVCLPFLSFAGATPYAYLGLAALGFIQLGISYVLYAWALRHVTALEAVLVTVLEPLLNPVWVALATGETPSPLSMIGGLVVLSAVLLRARFTRAAATS